MQDSGGGSYLWSVLGLSIKYRTVEEVNVCFYVTDLLDKVTEFQKEAKQLLEPKDDEHSIAELSVLQETLERGAGYGIDLPEIARLKLVSG